VVAFALQAAVHVVDVAQVDTALGSSSPRLYELQHLVLDVVVGRYGGRSLQERGQVVEELSRSYLLYKVCAAVLDARVCEL
jgi:uncharacterized protein (DUF779 family)